LESYFPKEYAGYGLGINAKFLYRWATRVIDSECGLIAGATVDNSNLVLYYR
jgi:hypothetical protein